MAGLLCFQAGGLEAPVPETPDTLAPICERVGTRRRRKAQPREAATTNEAAGKLIASKAIYAAIQGCPPSLRHNITRSVNKLLLISCLFLLAAPAPSQFFGQGERPKMGINLCKLADNLWASTY